MRRLFVGGNWKCNNTFQETQNLVKNVYNKLQFNPEKVDVIAAPVFIHIPWVHANLSKNVQTSAQNSSNTQYGAFTGEIAPKHLADMGLKWTILGHSERRAYYGESSELIAQKTKLAIESGLQVIACCGESLQDRESGKTMKVVESQLNPIKQALGEADWSKVVIAYEPVWAIGTGKVASPEQAQEVHLFIRQWMTGISSNISNQTRVIYGGSVSDKNSDELVKNKDIDGFLVGGAALKPAFSVIVESCNK